MVRDQDWTPEYEPWRHGGWYVTNVRYPSGAVGCVSRNYPDRKWRIVCDSRPWETAATFPTRDAAARAERARTEAQQAFADRLVVHGHWLAKNPDGGPMVPGERFALFTAEPGTEGGGYWTYHGPAWPEGDEYRKGVALAQVLDQVVPAGQAAA